MNERFVVGIIRGSHGVTGNFKVESTSGEYEHFADMEEVTLRNGKTGSEKLYKVEGVELSGQTLLMKLAGIDSPEEVKKINGCEIVVPREYACPLDKSEWYVEDLKQCALVYPKDGWSKDGLEAKTSPADFVTVGTVTDVLEGGTGNLLEIKLAEDCNLLADDVKYTANGKTRTVLVPFKNEFIGEIDVQGKRIQLMHLWILE
ncbi:MAG: 16S rRNA processing protein RimM [Treponema sp.]|nr:16S rRNA processing protein RimM [Treponema sp.]